MRHLGKNYTYGNITYGKFLTSVEDPSAANILLAAGYVEFPSAAPSKAHRFIEGTWTEALTCVRHYLKPDGTFSHSAELAPDDTPAGFIECQNAPPNNGGELYSTADGGLTWALRLDVYKTSKAADVKVEAIKRANASFSPRSDFDAAYTNAANAINTATDKAGVDAAVAAIVWPA